MHAWTNEDLLAPITAGNNVRQCSHIRGGPKIIGPERTNHCKGYWGNVSSGPLSEAAGWLQGTAKAGQLEGETRNSGPLVRSLVDRTDKTATQSSRFTRRAPTKWSIPLRKWNGTNGTMEDTKRMHKIEHRYDVIRNQGERKGTVLRTAEG
ncbi:hypothetical protein PAAG_11572 [Paracoccidioides lutzii Pb01]|uniref:Uncharacterized protein n=1 Tax=Paracoccidioides lutzii (strain ATCC MYA-826 / Pb01) TaxID=502779 RepID=A0A0A2V1T1_PARBA|nr:hypothetical protein PAAG_11572 [Paracoccidioides lutzii Pb01]KGQ01721.1 hypothetical protein PAAG_11572 [Paracoccidioides lutzii Pb01]